jgi:hypothetical protein
VGLDDPVLAALRDRRLARALLARAALALREGDAEQARADLDAAADISPAEWRGRRLALRAAAAGGRPGVAAVSLCGAWWDRRRERRGPPQRIGDR